MPSLPSFCRYRRVGNRIEGHLFTKEPEGDWVDTPSKLTDQITPNTVWVVEAGVNVTTVTDLSPEIKAEIEVIEDELEKDEVKRKPGRPKKEV